MKKIITISVLAILLSAFVVPLAASAATGQATKCTIKDMAKINNVLGTTATPQPCGPGPDCVFDEAATGYSAAQSCAMCCMLNTVYTVTDWIFFFLVAVAAIMVLFGAFNLLFAGGSPEKIDSGRKYIIFAAVGLLVGLLARAIPALVKTLAGLG